MSVRPSARKVQLGSYCTDIHKIWYLGIFSIICPKNSSFIKIWQQQQPTLYMKTYAPLWQYLADFFLEWEMFQTKVVEKKHTLCSMTSFFFRKSCRLWDTVEKYGTTRRSTHDNIIRRMRSACWITKATNKDSEFVILAASHGNNGYANALNVTFIRTVKSVV